MSTTAHPLHEPQSVSLLLTNLGLLDYDHSAFPVTADVFTSPTSNKAKAFEHIVHHLYSTFVPEECALVGFHDHV